jgi:hypothetical protein
MYTINASTGTFLSGRIYKGKLSHPRSMISPQGADPQPPFLYARKAGRNNLNAEITPLFPTGIGERFSQTMSYLGHAALLRRCELPL